ncbi:MAG TPA: hypothetical protein VG756_31305 [Pseudonocardiaceae bacterium]|nr:hypothetical protein [Pseudonocardiaceae bacterium]
MLFERRLDGYEELHLHAPTAFVADCAGEVDERALAYAFDILGTHYPALRGQIHPDALGYLLTVPRGRRADFRVVADTGEYPRNVARAWNARKSLATLVLARGVEHSRVALYVEHAIGDGRNMYALLTTLFRLYKAIVRGTQTTVTHPARLPQPPLSMLANRAQLDRRAFVCGPSGAPTPGLPTLHRRRILLSDKETSGLRKLARTRGITVYTLLCGVLLGTQRDHMAHSPLPVTMRVWPVVDLRERVRPPVGATETTNFASAAELNLRVPAEHDRIALGRAVGTRLERAIAEGRPQLRMAGLGAEDAPPAHSLAAAIISNLGVVEDLPEPAGLDVTDVQIWPYGWRMPYPMYMMHTYRGRLSIEAVFRTDVFAESTVADLVHAATADVHTLISPHETVGNRS